MGITGLAAFLHEYFTRGWSLVDVSVPPLHANEQYDYLYIDANSLLYSNNKGGLTSFFLRLQGEIDRFLRYTGPPKAVFVALDGPAPLGKIFEQRKRRQSRASASADPMNPVQFTPGTALMGEIKQAFFQHACRLALTDKFRNTKFFVSGSDREGEGEFKIFEHLAKLPPPPPGKREKVLVVGNDSDLILFGLAASVDRDIFILKEKSPGQPAMLYDVNALREEIIHQQNRRDNPIGAIENFMVATFMRGNDYLPKLGTVDVKGVAQQLVLIHTKQLVHLPYALRVVHLMRDIAKFAEFWRKRQHETEIAIGRVMQTVGGKDVRDFFVEMFMKLHSCKESDINSHLSYVPNPAPGKYVQASLYVKDVLISNSVAATGREAEMLAARLALESVKDKLTPDEAALLTKYDALRAPLETNPFAWTMPEPLKISALAEGATPETPDRYMGAINWMAEYYAGRCLDYQFVFPENTGITSNHIASLASVSLDLSPSRNNLPLSPVSCALALIPAKLKQFIPAHFQPLYDNPDLPLSGTDAKLWADPKAVTTSLDAAVMQLSKSLTLQQRRSWLWFHPTLLIQRRSPSPAAVSDTTARTMAATLRGGTVGSHIANADKLECLAENRADFHLDAYQSFNIPYNDEAGGWQEGVYIKHHTALPPPPPMPKPDASLRSAPHYKGPSPRLPGIRPPPPPRMTNAPPARSVSTAHRAHVARIVR